MRHAIYAGSFDPPTLGHQDVIRRGAALFDRVTVAVGFNPTKKYWFDVDERCALIRAVVARDNVDARPFAGLLIHLAQELGADVILRGIRGAADLELELRNGIANREMSGIETMFLLTDPLHAHVSSSLVKEIAGHGGDVARYVPPEVLAALAARRG